MTVRVELQRQGYTEVGTLGRWNVFSVPIGFEHEEFVTYTCLAAENPDRGNMPSVSCIPEGEYKLVRSTYHRGGYECFEIRAADGGPIPGRSLVKVHRGNTDLDVEGCIVLGAAPIAIGGHWGVGPSGGENGGFTGFMEAMQGVDECPLTIYFRKG